MSIKISSSITIDGIEFFLTGSQKKENAGFEGEGWVYFYSNNSDVEFIMLSGD